MTNYFCYSCDQTLDASEARIHMIEDHDVEEYDLDTDRIYMV